MKMLQVYSAGNGDLVLWIGHQNQRHAFVSDIWRAEHIGDHRPSPLLSWLVIIWLLAFLLSRFRLRLCDSPWKANRCVSNADDLHWTYNYWLPRSVSGQRVRFFAHGFLNLTEEVIAISYPPTIAVTMRFSTLLPTLGLVTYAYALATPFSCKQDVSEMNLAESEAAVAEYFVKLEPATRHALLHEVTGPEAGADVRSKSLVNLSHLNPFCLFFILRPDSLYLLVTSRSA